MGTAVNGIDVVGISEDLLVGAVDILHGDFDVDIVFFAVEVQHFGVENIFIGIEHGDEFSDTALEVEEFLNVFSFVSQSDAGSAVWAVAPSVASTEIMDTAMRV